MVKAMTPDPVTTAHRARSAAAAMYQHSRTNGGMARNAVNYGAASFALTRFAALRCPAVADWILGSPGGFSVFLCGQSRAFLRPRRT